MPYYDTTIKRAFSRTVMSTAQIGSASSWGMCVKFVAVFA